jgi:hypothetical protein
VLVGGDADPEVHVRACVLRLPARSDGTDLIALADGRAFLHREGAEVRQGHRIAVGCRDSDRQPVRRHGAREGDGPAHGRPNRLGRVGADVDAAVLPAGEPNENGRRTWPPTGHDQAFPAGVAASENAMTASPIVMRAVVVLDNIATG